MFQFGYVVAVALSNAFLFSPVEPSRYPKGEFIAIGGQFVANGRTQRIGVFRTDDEIEVVARYFIQTWEKHGLPVLISRRDDELTASAMQPREQLIRMVALRRFQGKVVGTSALTDVEASPQNGPDPYESTALLKHSMAETKASLPGTTEIVRDSPASVRKRVTTYLGKQGFAIRDAWRELGGEGISVAEFGKGDQLQTAVVLSISEDLVALTLFGYELWDSEERSHAQ